MPKFKIVLERTDAVTYQAVVFANAADPHAANEAAKALDEAGKLAWDAATSSRGDAAGVETAVATADEMHAVLAQRLLDIHRATPGQVGPAHSDNNAHVVLLGALHELEAFGPFAGRIAAEAWVDGNLEIEEGGYHQVARLRNGNGRLIARGPAPSLDETWGKQPRAAQLDAEESLRRAQRIIELLGAYGRAKFGDEWWPGHARPWLGAKKGAELEELVG